MIYELRSYYLLRDHIASYLTWANAKALPLLQGQFGFRVVGFWRTAEVISTDGTAVDEDGPDVVWLIAWVDRAEREKRWTTLESDELWRDTVSEVVPYRRREGIVRLLEAIPRSILQ
jgi:NIPSNAP